VAFPTSTIELDTPVTQEIIHFEAFRVVYVNDAAVPHQFLVENPGGKSHVVRIRNAAFEQVHVVASPANPASRMVNLPTGTAGAALPVGVWFLEVKGNLGTTAPFTVTVVRP
jgi:hypothetical protein